MEDHRLIRDVSGREVRFFGPSLIMSLRCRMHANQMGYALRMARLRREAEKARAHLQREIHNAEADWERVKDQIPGWYGIN